MSASMLITSVTGTEIGSDGFLYLTGYYILIDSDDNIIGSKVDVTGTVRVTGVPDNAYLTNNIAWFQSDCRNASGEQAIPTFALQ